MLVPFSFMGGSIDAQALAHFNRVIADGGVIPAGLNGVNSFFSTIKSIYGTSNINTAISAAYDPHYLGYKMGAGSGTTLGQAAQTLYSTSGASADVTQGTAASQPLLLTHTGENYWWNGGIAGNFLQTPNAAANNIVNDFDIKITAAYIFNSTINSYIGKWDSGQQSWRLYLDTGNRLIWNIQGHALYPSNVINSTMNHLRVTRQASNGEIKYFFSTQALNTPIESITWTQLGTTQIGPTGSAPTTTSSLRIGQEQGNPFNGKIYRVTLANSIDGTPVVDFNPQQYTPSVSQTSWVSTTGETWTINVGTATTGYKGVLVDRSLIQTDGVDDTLLNTFTDTFRTTIAAVSVNRTGGFVGGVLNNANLSIDSSSQWFYTLEGLNAIDANNILSDTRFVNNAATTTYTAYRRFYGQIDLGATPNTANGRLIGFLSGNNYLLGNVLTLLQPIVNPNSTQRTAMYNYLRSINNNAF